MIYASVNLNIGDYESTCDKKIVLYRGDKNVEIRFVMIGNRFTVLESTYAQLIIKRPSATSLFSEPAPIQNETVILTVSEDMIDELKEIGEYTFQIRLYDNEMVARATLPPCEGCLIIERPIAVEAESAVNYASVNDSAVMVAENSVEEETFTDIGEYNRTIWVDGDLITDTRLNKIEDALYCINDKHANDMSLILNIIDEPPTYTKPTITISLSKQNVEHGVETSIAITPTFRQNDAGDVTSYSLFKDNNKIYTNTSVTSYTDTIYLSHGGVTTYKAVVSYSDGVIKNTLLGIAYPETSIKAGDISTNATVRGYALSYYGVIDGNSIDNINGLTPVLQTTKSSTLTFNMVNQRVVYMYPKTFGTLSSIKDANNFDYINSYTLGSITINDVDYYVYILTDAVTITNFKQIFN